MGMWKDFMNVFVPATPEPNALPLTQALAAPTVAETLAMQSLSADSIMAPVAAPAAPNLIEPVAGANQALAEALSEIKVKRQLINPVTGEKVWMKVNMPVESVVITTAPSPHDAHAASIGTGTHDGVTISITLKDGVGNYDTDSLNAAIHEVFKRLPELKGKYEFAHLVPMQKMDHDDVWKQLEPQLVASGKFSQQELFLMKEYFETHRYMPTEEADFTHYNVGHPNDMLEFKIRPAEVKGDAQENTSGETRIVEYFNTHKETFLAEFRKEIVKLNDALKDGDPLKMSAEEIADIDFTAISAPSQWGDMPTITFGSKPKMPSTVMGKSKVIDFDTDKLQVCFKKAFLASGEQEPGKPGVPWIFGRIADGDMVRDLIHARIGDNPALHAAMNHPMFNSQAEQKSHRMANGERDINPLANATEASGKPNYLNLVFDLPHAVNLDTFRESLIKHARVHGPQQTTSHVTALTTAEQQPQLAGLTV